MARARIYSGNVSAATLKATIKAEMAAKKKAKERIDVADRNIKGAKLQLAKKKS